MSNRLAAETSPYLRQHADNPVDWYPWGDEAFAAARDRDCPILLSVGYSACHWCHVMAHESFEHEPTAAQMNQLFVNVKVDREERPDVDSIYMDAVQAMTGSGGWPMTVFLTPDGRPFFGGTYFPRIARGGMISFTELLSRIDDVWHTRRDELVTQADELTAAISKAGQLEPGDAVPGPEVVTAAVGELIGQHDPEWGGFGRSPKFPQTLSLELLLRNYVATGDQASLDVVITSLDAMASGGIYDHLGGGFARYSVDREWLVPHFEKMLYDEALLARIYLHAWQVTREPRYLQVLAETIGYVLGDLRHDDGGFYSAEDADSEGVEGKFYVWSIDEVRDVLGPQADAAIAWWGITPAGNFEGANILVRPERGDLLRTPEIEASRQLLLSRRNQRVRPGLDDKVLTEWNALMLATVAEAAAATGSSTWLEAAVRNAEFLLARLRRADGRWLRSWHPDASTTPDSPSSDGGSATQNLAFASDYAALVDAFVRLAEATGQARWIAEARSAADGLIDLFWDDERGGVYTTGRDAPALVTRPKDVMDNAVPGANSLAANGLLRLAALTGELRYEERAQAILRLVGATAERHPTAFGHLLAAVDLFATGPAEIAIVGDRPDLVSALAEHYVPNAVVAWGERFPSPLWEGRDDGPDHAGQAYVCRNFACQAPVSDVEALLAQLAHPTA